MTPAEISRIESLLGFRVSDHPELFDFTNSVLVKRKKTPKLKDVMAFRGSTDCAIAYPGSWRNSRGATRKCTGVAKVVDHVVPLSSNRVRKAMGVRPTTG